MKNVSQSFKDNIKKYGRQLDSKITIGNLIIGKQDINSINPSFHTSLFKTVMKSFEIDCNLFIPKDEIINISIGVKFGNSGYEYIEYENFKVKSCEKQEDTESFKIIAYDKIIESMIDYDLELTQAISLREYIIKIFERLSWSTEGIPATFINSTKQINPSVHIGIGYTFRDVLDEIATITGSFIYIKNNVPTLGYITETNETINEEYLSQDDVTIGEKYLINSLVFSRAEESDNIFRKDDESIQENGLYEFRVEDNQIISTNDRDVYIDELFNYLKTLEFYIYDVKSTGIMWLDICDQFTFNIHGSTYSTIILNDEITVDQDIEEMLYVERPEETETDYKCADTTDKRINQAYILVNKQKQEITQRVNSVEQEFNKSIENLQSQIDGSIQFWNGSDIPTASNYPASEWTTEEEKNKHRADIYTVIEDIDGELKQGKSYRFDKVGDTWQWIELTDNELSAVQALAQSKAKVFVTTPKVPYSIGDLWLNNGKLFECQVSKDASGSYSSSDWKEAVNYTDDTVANLAKTLANNAQSTADSAVEGVSNITNTTGQAEGKNIHIEDSAEEPLVDISLHGETSQKTRSGINLWGNMSTETIAGVTLSQNEDGSYLLNGTATGNANFILESTLTLGNYSFSCQYEGTLPSNASKRCEIIDSSNDVLAGINNNSENTYTVNYTNQTEQNIKQRIRIQSGHVYDNVILYPLLVKGTYTSDTMPKFEPYGIMPSPEFPSEIENAEGKNKFSGFVKGKGLNSKNGVETTNTTAATSDYIAVDFNQNPNYYLSGLTNTLFSFVGAYNNNKEFLGRTTAGAIYFLNLDKSKFASGTAQGTGDIAFIRVTQYENETVTGKIDDIDNLETQLEKGYKATPYTPYNSLEVKVEGKNLLGFIDGTYTNNGVTAKVQNGEITLNGTATGTSFLTIPLINNILNIDDDTYSLSINNKKTISDTLTECRLQLQGDASYRAVNFTALNNRISFANQGGTYSIFMIRTASGITYSDFTIQPQLEEGTPTDYEPYKSQTAYFPLTEGQKLMEGSYIDDEGVHNTRGQVDLGISTSIFKSATTSNDIYELTHTWLKLTNVNGASTNIKCTHFKYGSVATIGSIAITPSQKGWYFSFAKTGTTTKEEFLAWIQETHPILEYELAEEEIVPYTEEQQEAWNKIKALTTYKNITNITSDAYAKVVYMRDNGLDVYETKQNADKRYTETTEKFAETKITTDSIKDTVSTTQTTVANNYQELKGKFDDYAPKSDIITIQNSVEKIQTDTYTKTEINTKLTDGSVTKVLTTAGTFDENGLTIEKTDAKTKGNFNERGITVLDATSGGSQELLFAGYDEELNETIVRSKNMTVDKYFVIGNTARQENYINPVLGGKGVGVFML